MKRMSTSYYLEGINSRNRFIKMLSGALTKALDGVELREEVSFDWQGYQIEKYPGLKDSQYYCMTYNTSPHILTFHEYYEMQPHVFQIEIDLILHGFFQLSYEQQFQFLVEFIRGASMEAIKWNSSQRRREIVPERFW